MRRGEASVGATLIRMAAVTLIVVLLALAARFVAATQPITIPVAVVAFAALGAAAVGEANRRWHRRRRRLARRTPVAARPHRTHSASRRTE
jgi:hypothetical protein